jgi:hypothetical protein
MKKEFTFQEAHAIQQEHLEQWAKVLNAEALQKLYDAIYQVNMDGYEYPYDVIRGKSMISIVVNIALA